MWGFKVSLIGVCVRIHFKNPHTIRMLLFIDCIQHQDPDL
ncbi:hypothetical protein SAMN04515617_12920 [Collimonas sp. OK242]|nr:hypothetical protein SAMN04515617_12920 [Collimonas sp. OK242]